MMTELIIIRKRTVLERHTSPDIDVDFLKFLETNQNALKDLRMAHNEHVENCNSFFELLDKEGLSYKVLTLDDLQAQGTPFYSNQSQGLTSHLKLIVSLGGDGTLLQASHYVGGSVALIGVNSAPSFSVGHLCKTDTKKFFKYLHKLNKPKKISRIRVALKNQESAFPFALNDVLFCNKNPGATSRYQISLLPQDKVSSSVKSERHISSGVWISTAIGQTAGIAFYDHKRLPLASDRILVAAREPYTQDGQISLNLIKFSFHSSQYKLSLLTEMRHGLICIDGHEYEPYQTFGDELILSSDRETTLNLHL